MSGDIAQWERSVVSRLAAGDDTALALAFDQYGSLVMGIARRMVGCDLAASVLRDVFALLWDDPERVAAGSSSLRVALATAARERSTELLRGGGRRERLREHDLARAPVVPPNVDEAVAAMLDAEVLRAAFRRLPSQQRTAIELTYFAGLSFRELAVHEGTSEATATSRVRAGLSRLALELGSPGEVEIS